MSALCLTSFIAILDLKKKNLEKKSFKKFLIKNIFVQGEDGLPGIQGPPGLPGLEVKAKPQLII